MMILLLGPWGMPFDQDDMVSVHLFWEYVSQRMLNPL